MYSDPCIFNTHKHTPLCKRSIIWNWLVYFCSPSLLWCCRKGIWPKVIAAARIPSTNWSNYEKNWPVKLTARNITCLGLFTIQLLLILLGHVHVCVFCFTSYNLTSDIFPLVPPCYVNDWYVIVKEPYMQQLKVFLKEASHQELLPTIRRFVDADLCLFHMLVFFTWRQDKP